MCARYQLLGSISPSWFFPCSQGQADISHSPSAAAEGESLAAKPGAIQNQHCSVLFQLPLLVLPSPPSTWQGSCTASSQAGGAGPCASVPSSSPSSWPPSSPCPAPATTSTTGKVGEVSVRLHGAQQGLWCVQSPQQQPGRFFCTPPVAILVPLQGTDAFLCGFEIRTKLGFAAKSGYGFSRNAAARN